MATKLYLHRGTTANTGTLPGSTALGGTPTVSATGASTNRIMDVTIGVSAQTSAVSTTDGTANAQTAWHTRHLSAPLAAQTISAQIATYSGAFAEANIASNFNPTIFVGLWDPVGGTLRSTILAVGTLTVTEPGTTQTAGSATATTTSQTATAGDMLVIETWRKSIAPGATTARTNTTFYDGTTEASTSNVATFVNFANTLNWLYSSAPAGVASFTGPTRPTASVSRTLTGAVSSAGSTLRSVARTLTGAAMSFAGALTTTHVFTKAVAGALSFVGAATRAVARTVTAAGSFTGGENAATRRALAGVGTFAGAAARGVTRIATASASFAGAASRSATRSLSAATAFGGLTANSTARLAAAALSFVGSLGAVQHGGAVTPSLRAIYTSRDSNWTGG